MLSYFEVFRVPTLPRSIGELQGNRKGLPLQSAESKYVTRLRWLLSVGFPMLLVFALISACGGTTGGQGSQQLTPMTLALDWTPNTNHTGIYVALAKNWYRDQRIDLKLLPYSSSVTPDTLVANGKADVGIGFTEGVVADAAVNQPVVSIAAIIQHNTSALVTLASSGITRPRDLEGKTYGGFGAPYETPVISQVIKHDGGRGAFKNVTVNVDPMEALKTHQVDFVWVYEGWEGIQAQREGMQLTTFPITSYGIPDYYSPVIITNSTTIKQKSDLLHKFMKATEQGYEYARTNPKDAAQLLINTAPKGTFPDTGLVFSSQDFLSLRYAEPGHKWGIQDISAWRNYPTFILDAGGVTDASGKPVKSLNLNTFYTNQFLS